MFSSHFDMTCNSYEDDISYNNNKEDLDDNKENKATWHTEVIEIQGEKPPNP